MTGYNTVHGDTAGVQLDLDNDYFAYTEYQGIINRTCWWDEDDNTWNDVDKAAQRVHSFVTELVGVEAGGAYGEIMDADLDAVNWVSIITDVLRETNLQEGRAADAGFDVEDASWWRVSDAAGNSVEVIADDEPSARYFATLADDTPTGDQGSWRVEKI